MNETNPPPIPLPDGKPAVASRTMWVNALAPVLSWLLALAGVPIPPEVQIAALGLLNLALRKITREKIDGWW